MLLLVDRTSPKAPKLAAALGAWMKQVERLDAREITQVKFDAWKAEANSPVITLRQPDFASHFQDKARLITTCGRSVIISFLTLIFPKKLQVALSNAWYSCSLLLNGITAVEKPFLPSGSLPLALNIW